MSLGVSTNMDTYNYVDHQVILRRFDTAKTHEDILPGTCSQSIDVSCNTAPTSNTPDNLSGRLVPNHTSPLSLDLVLFARNFLSGIRATIDFSFRIEWIINDRL